MKKGFLIFLIFMLVGFLYSKQIGIVKQSSLNLGNNATPKTTLVSVMSVERPVNQTTYKDLEDISLSPSGLIAYIPRGTRANRSVFVADATGSVTKTITIGKDQYMVDWLDNNSLLIGVTREDDVDNIWNTYAYNIKNDQSSFISKGNYGGVTGNNILFIDFTVADNERGIYQYDVQSNQKKLLVNIGKKGIALPKYLSNGNLAYIDWDTNNKESIVLLNDSYKTSKIILPLRNNGETIADYNLLKDSIVYIAKSKTGNSYRMGFIDYSGSNNEDIQFSGINMSTISGFKWYEDMKKVVLIQGTTAIILDLE